MAFFLRNISRTTLFAAGIIYIKLQHLSECPSSENTHVKIIPTMEKSTISSLSTCMPKINDFNEASLSVVPLHQHPDLTKQCCELVNEEWPRSETARMMSLTSSCDKMPTCLILLTGDKVIGHCKLTPIPSIKDSCFIESVVISKSLRGKGLGTFLMKASEEYCRLVLRLKTIHLSTKGQEEFYSKLGYSICEPITIYGSFSQINKQSTNIMQNKFNTTPNKIDVNSNNSSHTPPPPPLVNISATGQPKQNKTYMVKSI